MLNRNKNKIYPARALLAYSEGLKNFLETLRTPATAGAKSFSPKGVGCLLFLNDETVVGKVGKHVLITGGVFDGVTGVIRRVKRCKRVVVELEGIATVAIAFVPSVLLKEI